MSASDDQAEDLDHITLYHRSTFHIPYFENPFVHWSEETFIDMFRVSKDIINHVLYPLVAENLDEPINNLQLTPLLRLLYALRYFATGSFAISFGQYQIIDETAAKEIVSVVAESIAHFSYEYVKMPSIERIYELKNDFYEIAKFPGVIGCVGNTHIDICNTPLGHEVIYDNQIGTRSINVQFILGPNGQIFNLNAQSPGSHLNSYIFFHSRVKKTLETGQMKGFLLGDCSYESFDYFLTHIHSPKTIGECKYNEAHKATCSCINKFILTWKSRFNCLCGELDFEDNFAVHVITACAVLNNLCVIYGIPSPEILEPDFTLMSRTTVINPGVGDTATSLAVKKEMVARFFDEKKARTDHFVKI